MQGDAPGIRLWWLTGIAIWAGLIGIFALIGFGERVALLPNDSSLIRHLPALPPHHGVRLKPLSGYSEISERPMFAEDRLPHPFVMGGGASQESPQVIRLTGVLMTPSFKMATLTTEQNTSIRLRLGGDSVEGWRLLSLEPRSATVEGTSGPVTLTLEVYNGASGQGAAQSHPSSAPAEANEVEMATPGGHQVAAANDPAEPQSGEAESPESNEAQMKAIRERIEARRRQIQQEQMQLQQSQNSGSSN